MIATVINECDSFTHTFTNLVELRDYLDYLEGNGISFKLIWEPNNG